jgi:hypothetical protein
MDQGSHYERVIVDSLLLRFEGVARPICLIDCRELLDCFEKVFHGWHHVECAERPGESPIITIRGSDRAYSLEAPWLSAALRYRDEVSAVCAFVAELFQALIRSDSSLLCLHGGAVEFAGRLVIFPSRYRAGKSVLCGCLAAQGRRLFADDVLPLREADNYGVAPGTKPRLRLPLPDDLGDATRRFLKNHAGLASKRYLYLDLPPEQLARRGETAPIGGFVLLERDAAFRPSLSPVKESEVLRRVILQNFAREHAATDLMRRMRHLVASTRCYRLRYARAEDAVELLQQAFEAWPDGDPVARPRDLADSPSREIGMASTLSRASDVPAGHFKRHPGAAEVEVDGERFLADPSGIAVHHLNPIGSAVWTLLEHPVTIKEATDTLHAAFPDLDRGRLERDVTSLIKSLTKRRLLIAGPASESEPRKA